MPPQTKMCRPKPDFELGNAPAQVEPGPDHAWGRCSARNARNLRAHITKPEKFGETLDGSCQLRLFVKLKLMNCAPIPALPAIGVLLFHSLSVSGRGAQAVPVPSFRGLLLIRI